MWLALPQVPYGAWGRWSYIATELASQGSGMRPPQMLLKQPHESRTK